MKTSTLSKHLSLKLKLKEVLMSQRISKAVLSLLCYRTGLKRPQSVFSLLAMHHAMANSIIIVETIIQLDHQMD
jgi:hypothetical protein